MPKSHKALTFIQSINSKARSASTRRPSQQLTSSPAAAKSAAVCKFGITSGVTITRFRFFFSTKSFQNRRQLVAVQIVCYTENSMILTDILMGRSDEGRDRFKDWRLDTDDMTYEQLVALGDKMGYVSTGLKESEIQRAVKKKKFLGKAPSPFSEAADPKCSICQEEYDPKDKLGLLICAHSYHRNCIKQWLRHKKTCPVCKSEVVARR